MRRYWWPSTSPGNRLPRPSTTAASFRSSLGRRSGIGRYWRRSARELGGEKELGEAALRRLTMLRLIERSDGLTRPLPALNRFALGDTDIRAKSPATVLGTR